MPPVPDMKSAWSFRPDACARQSGNNVIVSLLFRAGPRSCGGIIRRRRPAPHDRALMAQPGSRPAARAQRYFAPSTATGFSVV